MNSIIKSFDFDQTHNDDDRTSDGMFILNSLFVFDRTK